MRVRAWSWWIAMAVAAMVVRPGSAVAQRPAQVTIGVSVTVLPAPRPTMDSLVVVRPSAGAVRDTTIAADPRRRVRVLAWVGT